MSAFHAFVHYDSSLELKEKFLAQAGKLNLRDILAKHKKNFRIVMHKSTILSNVYLVMIVSNNDETLIELAKECNFPRGFPILWCPDKTMTYYGFYPKFDNDERQLIDDTTEFNDVVSLRFFKKFSGFLGQLIAFEIDGTKYWTVTSKNSADYNSEFVQNAKRIFEPYMTTKLIDQMIFDKIHICAEVMSKTDQVHGTRVFKEAPVITCVGQSSDIKFVNYFEHQRLVDFCTDHQLPCDSAIIIDTANASQMFLKALSTNRDFMDDEKLEKLIQTIKNIVKYGGTINHKQILGDCLEGIVMHLVHQDGKKTTKKYKFPKYTIRTMLIREQLTHFMFSASIKKSLRWFVNNWCVTEEGKKYWYRFGLLAFYTYDQMDRKKFDPTVGEHIQLAELVQEMPVDTIEEQVDAHLNKITTGTVIIIGGPIGSGKTTMMHLIQKTNPDKFQAIDGDLLGMPDMKTVLQMGKERADYSRWLVIKALMQGKVPVISAGGGIFFSMGRQQNFELVDQIYKTLGIIVKVIFLLPSQTTEIIKLDKTYDPVQIYNNESMVISTVSRRVKNGEWTIDPRFKSQKTTEDKMILNFGKFIYSKSQGNHTFALKLIQEANEIFGFPVISSENYGIQNSIDVTKIIETITSSSALATGKFNQIRILTQVDNDFVGHITMLYGKSLSYSLDEFALLQHLYEPVVSGLKMTLVNGKNEVTLAVPFDSIHDDGSTHITIDSGAHEPKEMKQVAIAIKAGSKQITLPIKNGTQTITYNMTVVQNPCSIKILGVFGI
jgi:shikimate kinase